MDCMTDLETMGIDNDAVIIAIGAVVFDVKTRQINHRFYCRVDPQSCLDIGMTITGNTILWWLQQSDAARAEFRGTLTPIKTALEGFTQWVKGIAGDKGKVSMWGNGATFDNVLLTSAYKLCKMDRPWTYTGDRCYRTLKALFPDVPKPELPHLTGHRADHDAERQAVHLMDIWQKMRP